MNILMIGNGFDLEHNLPTKYTDFLVFIEKFRREYEMVSKVPNYSQRIQNKDMRMFFENDALEERRNILNIFIDNNLWIQYFNNVYENHLKEKENWIDFESEISNIVQCLDQLIKCYELLDEKINTTMVAKLREKLFCIVEKTDLTPDKIKGNIEKLLYDLNRLIGALEIYICDYVGKLNIEYYNPDIEKIYPDKVFSFNYSDTYKKVYGLGKRNIQYSYAHGRAVNNLEDLRCGVSSEEYANQMIEKNNMVLGIDEYLEDKKRDEEVDFIAFKKYYQRIYKKTGNEYKRWLQQIDENYGNEIEKENTLYIFGHSLDKTDGDILREFILHPYISTVIFYRDKKQLGQQIANLVKVLGCDNVIQKVYGNNPTIVFKKQCEKTLIQGSPFEIALDTVQLEYAYKLDYVELKSLMEKIVEKVKCREKRYFYSQQAVITLFDILARNGVGQLYRNDLLKIACNLMKNEGLQKAEVFDEESWSYMEYDNRISFNPATQKFINCINQYNSKNFKIDKVYIENTEQVLKKYQELVDNKKDMDETAYEEFLKEMFSIYKKRDCEVEQLWVIVLRVSGSIAEGVAKSVLNELINKSKRPLICILCNHLLDEICMNEYFQREAEQMENTADDWEN